jgi:hypothetical protein
MRRTRLTVVVGVGVDLLLLIAVLDWQSWFAVVAVIAASSARTGTRKRGGKATIRQGNTGATWAGVRHAGKAPDAHRTIG